MNKPIVRLTISTVMFAASLAGSVPVLAQTSDSTSTQSSSNSQPQASAASAAKQQRGGEPKVMNSRSLFFPDMAHGNQPLSSGEKFKLAVFNDVSPAAFLGSAASAGIGQAADSPAGYGQGASAYGQRFGASMANRATSNFVGTYFLSSVLHDDPRFFVMGDGSLKQNVKYALRRVVIVRKDRGGEAFNWPGLIGPLAAAGLANTYLPDAQRTASYTFRDYGVMVAASAGANLLKEYWPTITRKILVPMKLSHEPSKP